MMRFRGASNRMLKNRGHTLMLAQVLDAVDTEGDEGRAYGAAKPPVAPSSSIIKVDSGVDVRSLVRRWLVQNITSAPQSTHGPCSCAASELRLAVIRLLIMPCFKCWS